jgi:hypothetical protein
LERLDEDPTAGDLFEGELASVVARINAVEWVRLQAQIKRARSVFKKALPLLDPEVALEVRSFLDKCRE